MAELGAIGIAEALFKARSSPCLGAIRIILLPRYVTEGIPDLIGAGSADRVRLALNVVVID